MELDDLLKKATTKPTPDSYQLTTKEQKLLLHQAVCEISGKSGALVEVFLKHHTQKELLKDETVAKVFHRLTQDYIASLASHAEDYVKLATKMKDVEEWKIVATVESYNCQTCSNCKTEKTSYVGTFQILQHKKYWDRRNLVRLDEQVAAIHESKVFKTEQTVLACSSCRKFIDSSNLIKEYGSLLGIKG